jgi:hypothetical protein
MAFTNTAPADGLDCPNINDAIRDNFVAIQKGEHFTAASEPSYKQEGTPWYDSANNLMKFYNGTDWDSYQLSSLFDYGSSASAYTVKTQNNLKICFGTITMAGDASATISNLPFSSAASYKAVACPINDNGNDEVMRVHSQAASSFQIRNSGGGASGANWIAIGT